MYDIIEAPKTDAHHVRRTSVELAAAQKTVKWAEFAVRSIDRRGVERTWHVLVSKTVIAAAGLRGSRLKDAECVAAVAALGAVTRCIETASEGIAVDFDTRSYQETER